MPHAELRSGSWERPWSIGLSNDSTLCAVRMYASARCLSPVRAPDFGPDRHRYYVVVSPPAEVPSRRFLLTGLFYPVEGIRKTLLLEPTAFPNFPQGGTPMLTWLSLACSCRSARFICKVRLEPRYCVPDWRSDFWLGTGEGEGDPDRGRRAQGYQV